MTVNLFKKPLLGVDVGSRTIKGVRLQKKGNRIALENYFFVDLAHVEKANRNNSAECLKASVEIKNLKNSRSAACIPDRDVIRLALELPEMKAAELRTAVGHELSENTGINEQDLTFDFVQEKSNSATAAQENISITAYGTTRKSVESVTSLLGAARLKTEVVESDTLAISAMLEFNGYFEDDGVYIVFDLGESHLTASLICQGELKLSRSCVVGWGKVNDTLSERFGLSYDEAENCKKKYDFNSSNQKEEKTEHAIDDVYASIISEIKKSIEIFTEYSSDTAKIDKVILVGGGSQTKNLSRVLELYFKIPTIIANPFRNIDIFSKTNVTSSDEIAALAPYMAAAVGLALIGMTKKDQAA